MNYRVGGMRMSAMATNWRYKLLPGCLGVRRLCGARRVLGIAAAIQLIAPSYARATADAHKSVEIAPPNQEHSSGAMTVVELTPELETYRDAVRKMPDDPIKRIRYADELQRTAQRMRLAKNMNDQAEAVYQEAIYAYNKALALTPNSEKAHFGLYFCWDGLARLYEDDDTRWMDHMERALLHAREAHQLAPDRRIYLTTVQGYEKRIAMRREVIEKREAEAQQLEALNRPVADAEIESLFDKLSAIVVKRRPPVAGVLPLSEIDRYQHIRDAMVYDVIHSRRRVLKNPDDVAARVEYVKALRWGIQVLRPDSDLSLKGMGDFEDDQDMRRYYRVAEEDLSRQMDRLSSEWPDDMRVIKLQLETALSKGDYENIYALWDRALRANPKLPDGAIISQIRDVSAWTDDFIERKNDSHRDSRRRLREQARQLLARYPNVDDIIDQYMRQPEPGPKYTDEEAAFLLERIRRRSEERDFQVDSRIIARISDEERINLFNILKTLNWARLRWRWERKPDAAALLRWEDIAPYIPENMREFNVLFRPGGGEYEFSTADGPIRYVPHN